MVGSAAPPLALAYVWNQIGVESMDPNGIAMATLESKWDRDGIIIALKAAGVGYEVYKHDAAPTVEVRLPPLPPPLCPIPHGGMVPPPLLFLVSRLFVRLKVNVVFCLG